jgi:hypothetical protein
MTDLATPDAPSVSTSLDPNTAPDSSGAGQPRTLESDEPAKDEKASLRDTIASAVKDADKKPEADKKEADADKKPDEDGDKAKGKAEPEKGKDEGKAKPDAAKKDAEADVKAEKADAEPAKADDKQADAKSDKPTGHIDPPKSFLPDAKETWRNTPRAVQRDINDTITRHQQEVERYRESHQRYEPLRQYDEIARRNGRQNGLQDTLQEVAQLEDMMGKNPVAALNSILNKAGPRKPDGTPYSLFEVANAIVKGGERGYHNMVSQASQQQQANNDNSRVAQLEKQIQDLKAGQEIDKIEVTVIAPFKAAHPRYEELQQDIAFFLKSGKIPPSLSLQDRLAAAYDMAVRVNPASHIEPADKSDGPDPGSRVDPQDSSGSKSIKSAPGSVSQDIEPDRGGSIQDVLRAELRRTKRA